MIFDDLVKDLRNRFEKIGKERSDNATYTVGNMLMSGFALFSLKDSSLSKFIRNLKNRTSNLKTIFHISQAPSDTAMRTIIDEVPTQDIKQLFIPYIEQLDNEGILVDYTYLGRLLIPLDGTRYFSSNKISCKCCLTTEHQNGTITYHHDAICACIVHPNHKEVFPIGIEDICKQDGQTKNDCETNAAKRLVPQIIEHTPWDKILLGGDAIYATGPMVLLTQQQALLHHKEVNFIFSVKPKSHAYLFLQFERLEKAETIKHFTSESKSKKYVTNR